MDLIKNKADSSHYTVQSKIFISLRWDIGFNSHSGHIYIYIYMPDFFFICVALATGGYSFQGVMLCIICEN